MNQQHVECPVCEARFEPSSSPGSEQLCPECGRIFELTDDCFVKPTPLKTTPVPVAGFQTPPLATHVAKAANEPPQPSEVPGDNASSDGDVTPVDFDRAKRQYTIGQSSRKNGGPLLMIGLLAIVALPLVIALPFLLEGSLNNPESSEEARRREIREAIADAENEIDAEDALAASESEIPAPDRPGDLAEDDDHDSTPLTSTDATGTDAGPETDPGESSSADTLDGSSESSNARLVTQRPPDPEFTFLKEREFEDIWRRHQRRVLRLIVETPLGEHHAVGTIVDSRGWVATSFRAVAGATRIKVVQTAGDFNKFTDDNLLTDEARGVIATDPANDLAIISVNRRFVIDFSSIPLGEEDRLVGSQHLAQLGFLNTGTQPGLRSPLVGREALINSRRIPEEFSAQGREVLNRYGMTDPVKEWVCNGTLENASPGAPLIDPDGVFQGINTDISVDDVRLVCSSKYITELTKGAEDSPEPISTLSNDLAAYGLGEYESALSLRVGHPLGDVVVKLNRAASECESFRWLPSDEEQYLAVQRFLFFAAQIEPVAAAEGSAGTGGQEFAEKFNSLKGRFTSRFLEAAEDEPELVDRVNRMTIEAIQSATRRARNRNAEILETDPDSEAASQILFAFCNVFSGPMDSPRNRLNQETVTYQFSGYDDGVLLPWNPDRPAPGPESGWFVVFQTPPRGSAILVRRPDNTGVTAHYTGLIEIVGQTDTAGR
ncbi:MAG: trypsin-like peptidase domain-containing protein [Planctomycetota bacterium]